MANNHSTLTSLFTDIADAIREKTGSTESIVADEFPAAIAALPKGESVNLDSEITTQDALIAELSNILDSKAAGGSVKTTKTIHLDWSMDEERIGYISYVSNGKSMELSYSSNVETIEAEGGAFYLSGDHQFSSNTFINIGLYSNSYIATQDEETIYFVSSGEQQ